MRLVILSARMGKWTARETLVRLAVVVELRGDMNEPSNQLPAPQFSLRSLMLGMTLLSVLMGLCWWVTPSTVVMVVLVLLVVGAHVMGNMLGTQLRDGRRPPPRRPPVEHVLVDAHPSAAPKTHLSRAWSLGWTTTIAAGAGILLGMASGWFLMRYLYGTKLEALAVAISLVAFGTLGGLAVYLIATLLHVVLVAWWQAASDD